jgi:hypothetical protein
MNKFAILKPEYALLHQKLMDIPVTIKMPALKRTFARAEIALEPIPLFV